MLIAISNLLLFSMFIWVTSELENMIVVFVIKSTCAKLKDNIININ